VPLAVGTVVSRILLSAVVNMSPVVAAQHLKPALTEFAVVLRALQTAVQTLAHPGNISAEVSQPAQLHLALV
jgi:hypothetical protein